MTKTTKRRWHSEHLTLILTLLCAGAAWGFVEISSWVQSGRSNSIDEGILLALREPGDRDDPIGPSWFEEVMRDVTAIGGYTVITFLVASVLACLLIQRRWNLSLLLVSGVLGAMVVSSVFKSYFDRPRPDLVPHETQVYTHSFPSAHAMMSAATYLTLAAILVRLQRRRSIRLLLLALAVVLTLSVGASRIYLGVHWPSDVLAGWAGGAAWALLCWLLVARLGRTALGKDRLGSRRLATGEST